MNVKIIFWNFCFEEDITLHRKLKNALKKYNIDSEFAIWLKKNSLPNRLWDINHLLKFQKYLDFFEKKFFKRIYEDNLEIYLNSIHSRRQWQKMTHFDLTQIYRLQILAMYFYIKENKFTHYVSTIQNSQGFDSVFYKMVKKMNIKTLIFHSNFRNKTLYTETIEDWGLFKKSKSIFKGFSKDITKSINYHYETKNLYLKHRFNFKIFFFNPIKIFNYKYLYTKITNFKYNYNFYQFAMKEKSRVYYSKNLPKYYLYFPIHFQPEATTIGPANQYIDQAKIIEKISLKMPKKFKLIVKEHPAQNDLYHRSDFFYKRINNLKNVLFTNVNDDNDKLIKKCNALIAITGTAGFEALKSKTKVITFGKAWYNPLVYVYKWHTKINLDKIDKIKFNSKKFIQSFYKLSKKMADCVDSLDWARAADLTSDFKKIPYNEKIEIKKTASIINTLIKKHY